MGFIKTASAKIFRGHENISLKDWNHIAGQTFNSRTAAKLISNYHPDNYLLTHCTIIASVNVDPDVDHYITPETAQYVNNNGDSWESRLLSTPEVYRSFINSYNFLEHCQVPILAKGRIISAALREVPATARSKENIFLVDILVATDRKHKELINKISSGQLTTLSMGCHVAYTICSKCGHKASEESELCFTPDTGILISDGTYKAIKDIQIGDTVLTHKGNKKKVTQLFERNYQGNLKKIKVQGIPQDIKTTPNHPFLVLRPNEYCLCGCGEKFKEIKLGHTSKKKVFERSIKKEHVFRVFNPRKKYTEEEKKIRLQHLEELKHKKKLNFNWIQADQLQKGDSLVFPIPQEIISNEKITVGKARLLGYFMAEGSYLRYPGHNYYSGIAFALNHLDERETLAEEIKNLLIQEFPNRRNDPILIHRNEENKRGCLEVRLNGKEIVDWFFDYCGNYSQHKKFKEEILYLDPKIQENILGAFLSGDGSLCKTTGISGYSTSFALLVQLQILAARCQIRTTRSIQFNKKTAKISNVFDYSNYEQIKKDSRGWSPLYTLHIAKGETNKIIPFTYFNEVSCNHYLSLQKYENYLIYKIDSIEDEYYEGIVHNFEVEDDHSYIVEGVAVHNCNHIKYAKGSHFYDEKGKKRVIAELCGHRDDPSSVRFIEASWVAIPAFTGAVMRNILSFQEGPEGQKAKEKFAHLIETAYTTDPLENLMGQRKAASQQLVWSEIITKLYQLSNYLTQ